MDETTLASLRETAERYLTETCVVSEKVPVSSDESETPESYSNGMGGVYAREAEPTDVIEYRTYQCRRTVPTSLSKTNEYQQGDISYIVTLVTVILPWNAEVTNTSQITFEETNGSKTVYEVSRLEPHTDYVVKHVLCTEVK